MSSDIKVSLRHELLRYQSIGVFKVVFESVFPQIQLG